jgi:hypothetical protein
VGGPQQQFMRDIVNGKLNRDLTTYAGFHLPTVLTKERLLSSSFGKTFKFASTTRTRTSKRSSKSRWLFPSGSRRINRRRVREDLQGSERFSDALLTARADRFNRSARHPYCFSSAPALLALPPLRCSMDKGKSDRGARTAQSGIDENIPMADATSGDEGIDDASGDKPFSPGKPEKYSAGQSNDVDPERMGEHSVEDGPEETSTFPGPVSKSGRKPM